MTKVISIALLAMLAVPSLASKEAAEKPIQHMKVADVTSLAAAEEIFLEKTKALKSKKNLDEAALHEIHVITYSLEKSMAYYVKNLTGKHKAAAEAMAEAIEQIHINSENNRPEKTKVYLASYLKLAQMLPLSQ